MSVWQGLHGQDRVVAQLRRAVERHRVPHAYLFSGPPGAPMVDTAIALAMALSCLRHPGDGCDGPDMCDACAKIAAGIHPDIVTLAREGAAQIIPIESVRNQVIARMGTSPHEGEVRLFIVEEATSMAPPAANALLKTLEEPPGRAHFVLCTTAPEQLLPTIRSRCQRARFSAGTGLTSDADPARAERVAALGAELARDRPDPMLPSRIAETKGDCAPVLVAAANVLHARAHAAAASGDPALARRAAARAQTVLAWQIPVQIHNANPQLAIDALIAQLARQEGLDFVTPDEDVPDGPDDDGPDDGPDDAPAGDDAAAAAAGPEGQRRRRRRRRRRRPGQGDAPGDTPAASDVSVAAGGEGAPATQPGGRERRDYQRTHGAAPRGDDAARSGGGDRGTDIHAADPRATDPRGTDPRGNDNRRNDNRRGDNRGTDTRGTDTRGNDSRRNDNRATDTRGTDTRGTDTRGDNRRGDNRRSDNRRSDNRTVDSRAADAGADTSAAGTRADTSAAETPGDTSAGDLSAANTRTDAGAADTRAADPRGPRDTRERRGDRNRRDRDRGPRHRDDGTPTSVDAPTVRLDGAAASDGPTVRLDPRRPMSPPSPDDLDLEGPTAPAIPWGKDDDGPPPPVALTADLPADAPDDDPDPVTWPLLDAPALVLGDDVASVTGVRFVAGGRIQWCDAGDADYAIGERVLVDTERGSRLAWVAIAPSRRPVRDRGLRRVIRRANDHDLRGERDSDTDRAAALRIAKDKAAALRLPLKVFRIDLHGQLGRNARLNIYYTCDERIDVRELIREVSQATGNSRIELRQLGVRDEAKAVGGIGSCGLTLCCTTWLPDFVPVSIKMAKDQGLVLSPTKVSGQCGRLKCCLVYEQAGYAELRKGLPKLGKRVIGARGEGRVVEVDVLRQRVRVSYGPGDTEVVPAAEVRALFPSGNQPPQHRGTPSDPAIEVPDEAEDAGDSLEMPAAVDGTAPDAADGDVALADDDPSNAT